MNRRTFWAVIQLLVVVAVLSLGIEQAQAGPGGGTYYANSPSGGTSGTALRKFVDSLPGLGAANKNNLGSYIPIATPITGRAGVPADGDYYEVGVVEYHQKMHSDLPKKTTLRGYRDLSPAFANMSTQYLGPLIIAQRDRPVRVKMINQLPTGAAGNLFIPTDTSLMGAGMGALNANGTACDPTLLGATCASYTENRATFHLHGGNSPWISDGTPHQWTVPAAEVTPYKKGVSTQDVPDMPASGNGAMTFYWTNQQSGRLLFYHDHSMGITRLNVYAGEAAGYLLTDPVEDGLINTGVLPNLGGVYRYGVPLIIQDKTFVPQNIAVQDSLWPNNSKGVANNWGTYGDLWFPHVYEPNQDPTNPSGANPFGRWDYGPWFWPPISVALNKSTIPEPSTTPEAFADTMIVNGTAYPYLTVQPTTYRFRILNACNDRGLNLSIFYSDPTDPSGKEVKMVPAAPNPTFPAGPFPTEAVWPTDGRAGGVPDPITRGPKMIQIGTESGLLPFPVVHPNQPVNYDYNRRNIVVLNVLEKNLFLGPAERADVIVDFSAVPPGSNLILYNDAPAPIPAFDPRYDYYTGNVDQTASGGAPSTLRGFGPNTRTVMQFRVAGGTPGTPFNLARLQTELPLAFKAAQPAPLVPEPTLPVTSGGYAATELYSKIQDYAMTFTPVGSTIPTTIPFQPKAIQELWDPYGRMNATLGVELPFTTGRNQTTVPMGYAEPPTEKIIDGHAQIWKITHNGVDTHPVHFHMFDVQVVNRVGWDGAVRPPDLNELGWKETVRMNPLEDIIIALKPKAQTLPFVLPTSTRFIDPTLPATAMIATTDTHTNPLIGAAVTVPNAPLANPLGYDYGFEYVWHCHILGHEENDFMRPVVFAVSTTQAPQPTVLAAYPGGATVPGRLNFVNSYVNANINQVVLQWVDGAPVDSPSYFRIERSIGAGAFAPLTTISFLQGYPPMFTDTSVSANTTYNYQVFAVNALGDSIASNTATVTTSTWPVAASVTLVPSKLSPHVVGTNVQFTATATSAVITPNPSNLTVAYEYRFSLNGVVVQDFSNKNIWTLPDTTLVGNYIVTVDARTSASQTPLATFTINPYQVVVPPIAPVTLPAPIPGVYTAAPVSVTLSSTGQSAIANIYYTLDGSIPTTASPIYTLPIVLTATTTINYFAVDVNGVAEAIKINTWTIHTPDLVASVQINNGKTATNNTNVILSLSAFDPVGIASMSFSNDNVTYTVEEPYASTKTWPLTTGDGLKTVYVRFRDRSLPQPGGFLYAPVTAQITLDTVAPITAANPIPGTYAPMSVTLTANEPSTIYYTNNGTVPTTASNVYTVPILLAANTTLNWFAVDTAGNVEAVKTGSWIINVPTLTASVSINNNATLTKNATVTLSLSATTSNTGGKITGMQFSNTGKSTEYSAVEAFPVAGSATKTWTLAPGDGLKTIYVVFTETTNTNTTFAYPPLSANITLDTTPPVTTAAPVTGIYSSPIPVTMTTNEAATIYYTTDGTAPSVTSSVYTAPIPVSTTTTIRYFAVDTAGNAETPQTGTWTIQAPNVVSSISINNGATATNKTGVTLNISATSATGISTMTFSNDGTNYTAEEPYATTKSWTLVSGDGNKTVYARFRDGSGGGGFLAPPVTAQIVLDTVSPVTTASPITGSYSTIPLNVTLTANKPSTIRYTIDGSTPTSISTVYTGPISLLTTTTIKYFATDVAGNTEPVKTGTWSLFGTDLVASVLINNGAAATNNSAVILKLNAFDPVGIATMQFSNDGINYTAEEPYATSKAWTLVPGDGVKSVYVRFRDMTLPTGQLYAPVTAQINMDTVPPVTTVGPVTGTYAVSPVSVTMTANEPATIYYTTDGSTPTTASVIYTGPISLTATTTIKYFAVDLAGNVEAVKSGLWTLHTSDLVASVKINNGAAATNNNSVSLTLNAFDPVGIATMQFSNDGLNYSAEEPYATTKVWSLTTGDGVKTVYVRFRDATLGGGNLYAPITSQISLDTVAPVTTASPVIGTYSSAPVMVTLTTNELATIYYSIDGTIPTVNSSIYSTPISLSVTSTIKYFAVDMAGNAEAIKTGTWTIHSSDLTASVIINNGATVTNNTTVSLTLSAIDPIGIDTMQFSNDGINFTAEEPYATSKTWTLSSGDGVKIVYVRFRDKTLPTGNLYAPFTANIIMDTTAPVTTAGPLTGTYSTIPVPVTLTANETATIYYTIDGSAPTVASTKYTGTIAVSTTTTIKYFAVDTAGNVEAVKSGTWAIHVSDLAASVQINNGAIRTNNTVLNLTLSAIDPVGIATMQFSNDGVNYSVEEPYATVKQWATTTGDGIKTVYVRFRDKTQPNGFLYDPVTASVVLDTVIPVTTASPITGTYSSAPVSVTFTTSKSATVYYTVDGSAPSTASTVYSGPIQIAATTTIRYFAVDTAGNKEVEKSGNWTIHSSDMITSIVINNGAARTNSTTVTLSISAIDPVGVDTMQFSNDGVNFTVEEPYATTKIWSLPSGDGLKTVYIRFRDKSIPNGTLYPPIADSIVLDTTAPVTTAGPIPGTYSVVPVSVILGANEPATIYYTVDGSTPTTASSVYTVPINVVATTTIKYFAVDTAGNAESVNSGTWNIHVADISASVTINSGAKFTNKQAVTLTLNAIDSQGVVSMQFSNDGVNYSSEENYATTKAWTLTPGDGVKTLYVRFRDGSSGGGFLYSPVTAGITLDTVAPLTAVTPITGEYSTTPVLVTLTANEPAIIYYTLDGSTPTTASSPYVGPISISATTTVTYFAVDSAGNAEAVKTGTWAIHTSDMVSSLTVNNGALRTNSTSVILTPSSFDPVGVATMQFSNDGVIYSAEETYATTKNWIIPPGDGLKTIYVRFRDATLPQGNLYPPVTTSITLDTVAPVTAATPVTGPYAAAPVVVTLVANEPATIYFTLDGSTPTQASAVYTAPLSLAATTTVTYFAVDVAGNIEAVKSGTWSIPGVDLVASVKINNGTNISNNSSVVLTLAAADSVGVATMQFSNDGVNYSAEEPYANSKTWTLASGDGLKTVYVRFRDSTLPAGKLYDPVTATITYGAKDGIMPGSTNYLGSALIAFTIAKGHKTATPLDLAHADVAPYINGVPQPDGKIDLLDVYVILRRAVGLLPL